MFTANKLLQYRTALWAEQAHSREHFIGQTQDWHKKSHQKMFYHFQKRDELLTLNENISPEII